jgi:rsbT co-antagonist protein RsbR
MNPSPHDYEAFFRRAPAMLCILDGEGALRSTSDAFAALLDVGEADARSLVELAHPDDAERLRGTLRQAADGHPAPPCELRLRCKGGVHRSLRWTVHAGEADGALFGALTELDAVGRRFRFLVEAITDMIGIADFSGQTTYINPSGCAMLGYTLEEANTHNIMQYVPPHLRAAYQEDYIPTVMREGKWHGETELVRKDGSIMPAMQGVVILPDESGQPEALATLVHDITEQKRLEEALRQAIDELSTPMIQVWEGVLALPIVGVVDSNRATQMMNSLLETIQAKRTRIAVLDLTGVRTLDSSTIDHLFRMVRAAALLGSRCVISGMSPDTAQTVAGLGLDMGNLKSFRSLEEALRFAMREIAR